MNERNKRKKALSNVHSRELADTCSLVQLKLRKVGENNARPTCINVYKPQDCQLDRQAAARIKTILELLTERLDVYICEETPAGDQWRKWIEEHISNSQILLVLLPRTNTDLTWITAEIQRFQVVCPEGRLIIFEAPL